MLFEKISKIDLEHSNNDIYRNYLNYHYKIFLVIVLTFLVITSLRNFRLQIKMIFILYKNHNDSGYKYLANRTVLIRSNKRI